MMPSISFLSNRKVSVSLIRLRGISRDLANRCEPRYLGVTMPHRWVPVTERALFLGQIEKLLGSHALHGSESLCKLLRYLANHSLDHPAASPKEYQIATEVFGRQKDFDPHLDSMVRVQAGRLRAKLAEYYGSEGAVDSILVEMPKGNYILTFHQRHPGTGHDHAASSHETSDRLTGNGQPSRK